MADLFSSHFLTHAHGEAMQWRRVRLFGEMFYQLGDCGFGDPGHHGTPKQRVVAYGIANSARPKARSCPPCASTPSSRRTTHS
jgi:hypothetical protein